MALGSTQPLTEVSTMNLPGGKGRQTRGRGGPQGCETSRFPHFLDNRLTDGGEIVNLMRRSPFTPTKIPGTHFC
jgi:hypothetical protein